MPTTDDLIAEFQALRGPHGETPANETPEQRQERETRLAELHAELTARNALPRVQSRSGGFGSDVRATGRPGSRTASVS